MKRGFTLLELLIVISIMVILTAAVIGGSRGLSDQLKINNTQDKLTFMLQRARNLALSNKENNDPQAPRVAGYGLEIATGGVPHNTARIFADQEASADNTVNPNEKVYESYNFDTMDYSVIVEKENNTVCVDYVVFMFEAGTGKTSLYCNNRATSANMLFVKTQAGNKVKQFYMHRAAGIVQY